MQLYMVNEKQVAVVCCQLNMIREFADFELPMIARKLN